LLKQNIRTIPSKCTIADHPEVTRIQIEAMHAEMEEGNKILTDEHNLVIIKKN